MRHNTELAKVDGPNRRAVLLDTATGTKEELDFQVLHTAPPQSAPDWIRDSPLADPASPYDYLKVDKYTLRHPDWPDVFALGDAANLPTSKTGAAISKRAPSSPRTSWPPGTAHPAKPDTTATPPAPWSPRTTGCCSPSSTTPSPHDPPSR